MGKATTSGWHWCGTWGIYQRNASGGHEAAHALLCPTGTGSVPRRMPGAAREQQGQAAPQGCTPCSSVPGACPPWEVTGRHGEARAVLPAALPGAFPPAQEEGVCRQWKHGVFS